MPELKRRPSHRVNLFGKKEYDLHAMVKFLLMVKMMKRGKKDVATEVRIDERVVDVVDNELKIIYEVERTPHKTYEEDLKAFARKHGAVGVVIDLRKIPKEVKQKMEELAQIVDGYVYDV